ncbi:MAG: ACP S-malonyltransferase [Solirubrobacteraceae bacterium]
MPAKDTAVLFPGQGSQTDDMRERVERDSPELLEAALETVGGEDTFARANESTRFAQPAIYCASMAGWGQLSRLEPRFLAGHSLGEIAALAAAGSVSPTEGLRLVALRGELMATAAENAVGGGMMALVGGDGSDFAHDLSSKHGLSVANDNAPDQVVLSGEGDKLDAAAEEAKEAGVRAVRLNVQGAFHSPLVAEAREAFAEALAEVDFAEPSVPVFSGVTAQPFDDIPRRLAEGITSPVRWREILLALRGEGVERYVETGPGKVLTALVRKTLDDVEALVADKLETANA